MQLAALFPEIAVRPVRGNVQMLQKLDSGEYGALVLAAAGLHCLGLQDRITRYFSPDELLPAAGQGILAVQGRAGELEGAARLLDDADARVCALAERAFIRTLGGDASRRWRHMPRPKGRYSHLHGLYVTADERTVVRGAVTGRREQAASLGRSLALQLRTQAEGAL